MIALDASASRMSDSLMPPTAQCLMAILTSSVESFSSELTTASIEPCTSALMTRASSLAPPPFICSKKLSSVTLPFDSSFSRSRSVRSSAAASAARMFLTTKKRSPASGTSLMPEIVTGVEGSASSMRSP